ncbi:MAG TPA: hypothetical protein VF453_09225 [Burkholderiaceae bacterium]
MPTDVIATIRNLRAEAEASLHDVLRHVERARVAGEAADFRGMRTGLFELGGRMSSPRWGIECRLLLPAIAARTPLPRRVARLCADDGSRDLERLAELQEAVTAFELVGEPMHGRLELLALMFTEWHIVRREVFERLVVPLAQSHLTEEDWNLLDAQVGLLLRDDVPVDRPAGGRPRKRAAATGGVASSTVAGAGHDPLLRRRLLAHALRRCEPRAVDRCAEFQREAPALLCA